VQQHPKSVDHRAAMGFRLDQELGLQWGVDKVGDQRMGCLLYTSDAADDM
jgi:hypothetical protein